MKRKITLLATLLTLAGAAVYTNDKASAQSNNLPVVGHHEKHPAIHKAIRILEKAETELKNANPDFGGHRGSALKDCEAAIAELKLALEFDKNGGNK